ncbi:MAG: DNA polymerase III subunit delta [Candidatus Hydrogenedentes bacterium]|nr:DNA polymerase III subunit delta [Candidatus Hydrogenedentota bacterium]
MLVSELLRKIDAYSPPPVLLFCPGKSNPRAKEATFEPLLADEAVDKLVNRFVDPGMRDMGYGAFYADETPAGAIVLEAQTLPFLTERRVLLVRNADVYNAESKAGPLIHYLENPNETTLLLLVARTIDRRLKFFKACAKAGEVIESPDLEGDALARWLNDEAAKRDKRFDKAAVDELLSRSGRRLNDIRNAVDVVSTFVGNESRVREEDVRAACADVAEEEVWTLTDAIAASDTAKAVASLRKLVELGKAPDEIMGIINWLLKTAYCSAVPGASNAPVSPFVAKKVDPLVRKLGIPKLRDAFTLTTDTHFMMRSTGVDPNLALELLVIKLAFRRQARGAA